MPHGTKDQVSDAGSSAGLQKLDVFANGGERRRLFAGSELLADRAAGERNQDKESPRLASQPSM